MRSIFTSALFLTAGLGTSALGAPIPAAPASYRENFDSMGTGTTRAPDFTHLNLGTGNSTFTNATARPTSAQVAGATAAVGTIGVFTQTGTGPVSANDNDGYNYGFNTSDRSIGIAPTTIAAGVIQVALQNATGTPLAGVNVAFDMEVVAPGTGPTAPGTEELPGFLVYYSTDGGTQWTAVPALDSLLTGSTTVGAVVARSADVNFASSVAPGGPVLLRWIDDNAVAGSPDPAYGLDNVAVAAIPEPAAPGLLGCAGLLAARRRRRRVG